MHLMHEDLARAHSALRLEEAVRRERCTVSSSPTGRSDGPSRPRCAPAVSSPPPSSDESTATGLTETPGGRGTTRPTQGHEPKGPDRSTAVGALRRPPATDC